MVSLLWQAVTEGDLSKLSQVFAEGSQVDLEEKDPAGNTPLLQAVNSNNVDVVRTLLERGADHAALFAQGRPEQFTSDQTIIELLNGAHAQSLGSTVPNGIGYPQMDGLPTEAVAEAPKVGYYPPQYMYYPGVPPSGAMLPEGAVPYYPAPPPTAAPGQSDPSGGSNLPPPEIARMIPCRYFPACRYGPSCMFLHPQGPAYYQGPMPPPAQYPVHYDAMGQMAYMPYYPIPSAYPAPNGVPPTATNPMSPPPSHQTHTPPVAHARTRSEMISPVQLPFSPNGVVPPIPYGVTSPVSYPQPGPMPLPVGISALPPIQQGPINQNSQTPPYPPSVNGHHPVQGPGHHRDQSLAYSQGVPVPLSASDVAPQPSSLMGEYPPSSAPAHRETNGHTRRGSVRRNSTANSRAKPPCLFFPSGRCRNGDDCRFPHVMPDANMNGSGHFPVRYNGGRSRPQQVNGNGSLEEKMGALSVREEESQPSPKGDSKPQENGRFRPGMNGQPKGSPVNGVDKRNGHVRQRVPNADDFPVLAGSLTPPSRRSPGPHLSNGPTAAQVLQAPAPVRKDSFKDTVPKIESQPVKDNKPSMEESPVVNGGVDHLPLKPVPTPTFASVANSTSPALDAASQVSVSA